MTSFTTVPINITGGSYQSRSRPLSSQKTQNFYQSIVEEGRDQFILHPFCGLKNVGSVDGISRGIHNFNGVLYRVVGGKLYSVAEDGTHTDVGNIGGSNRMIIDSDKNNLIVVGTDGQFIYDGSTVSTITDPDIAGADTVTFLNNQMIYGIPSSDLFVIADPNNPSVALSLNAASAESRPDKLVRPYAFKQNCNMCGQKSIEPFWNSGQGNPPLQRIDGQILEVGVAAKHSVANTDEFMYFLGDDNSIYRTIGGQKQKISTQAINGIIKSLSSKADAIGSTFSFQDTNFYLLTFPGDGRTFCNNELLGENGWFELSSGTNGGVYNGAKIVECYGKNYVEDLRNGNLYELDINTYTDNNEVIQRVRTANPITSDVLGKKGGRVQMSRLELIMEKGEGLISGQGEDPQIMLEMSYDGGNTWTEEGWAKLGRLGDRTLKVEFFNLKSFYDAVPRFTITDPVPCSIYSASIDLRLAGW